MVGVEFSIEDKPMARVDLHNFFKFYDERNPNHIKAVQWMEDNLPLKFLEDNAEWAELYRGKAAGAPTAAAAAPSGDNCPHCGKPLGK
jgi:hypothetical protein